VRPYVLCHHYDSSWDFEFDPVVEMITHCQNIKYLRIAYDGCQAEGYGMDTLVKSLSNLPVLELVQLFRVALTRRNALLFYIRVMKKKSGRSMLMVGT
jgi:hypothetical protein